MDRVGTWLSSLGLAQYAGAFADADVDLDALADLSEADLAGLGVSLGHRKRMLRSIAAGEPQAGSTIAAPIGDSLGERRQLTVIFCDLVGSTALATRLDPEDLRTVISAYHARCAQVVTDHEGHVAQFLGDGVMVEFGYPRAHEDDVERAVRCALSLIEAVRDLILPDGRRLVARAGVATGTEVVGDQRDGGRDRASVVGSTPSLAARLQNIAEPETVVIATSTRRLLGDAFELMSLGEHAVKGFDAPIEVWRVGKERQSASRFAARRGASSGTFVGREQEIGLLWDRWNLARGGEGQALLLTADPGIGKSRIVEEFIERCADHSRTLIRLQCSPNHGTAPFHPVINQLAQAARFHPEDTGAERHAKLVQLVDRSPKPDAAVADIFALLLNLPESESLPPVRSLTIEQRKLLIQHTLLDQMLAYARSAPLIFLVEDLHWVDPSTLDVLTLVIETARHERIMVLATARPEFSSPWSNHGHLTTFALNRLNRQAVESLVIEICAKSPLPAEVLAQVVERADGVPLFVEELSRSMLEAGHFALRGDPVHFSIPETLRDALAARLDAHAPAREVAQLGAVIGRDFAEDLLYTISRKAHADVSRALAQLVDAGMMHRRDNAAGTYYSFKHALVRDVAYDSLLRPRRRELHLRVARALESRLTTSGIDEPEILGLHFEEGGLKPEAFRSWRRAADRAIARSAYREAAASLRRALALVPGLAADGGRTELELSNQLARVYLVLEGGLSVSARSHYERALALSQTLEESNETFAAQWGLCFCDYIAGKTEIACRRATDLVAMAKRLGGNGLMLEASHASWAASFFSGDVPAALEMIEVGVRLYRPAEHHEHVTTFGIGHDSGVCAYGHGSIGSILVGRVARARAWIDHVIALGESLGHPTSLVVSKELSAAGLEMLGEYRRAAELASEAAEIAHERNIGFLWSTCRLVCGAALLGAGEYERGMEMLAEIIDNPKAADAKPWRPYYMTRFATGLLAGGEVERAVLILKEAEQRAHEIDGIVCLPEIDRIWAHALRRTGAPTSVVVARFERSRETARAAGLVLCELLATTDLAEFSAGGPAAIAARSALDGLLARFEDAEQAAPIVRARELLRS